MKERYWPDPEIQQAIDDYCAIRQGLLEKKLGARESLVQETQIRLERALEFRQQATRIEERMKDDPKANFYQVYRENLKRTGDS